LAARCSRHWPPPLAGRSYGHARCVRYDLGGRAAQGQPTNAPEYGRPRRFAGHANCLLPGLACDSGTVLQADNLHVQDLVRRRVTVLSAWRMIAAFAVAGPAGPLATNERHDRARCDRSCHRGGAKRDSHRDSPPPGLRPRDGLSAKGTMKLLVPLPGCRQLPQVGDMRAVKSVLDCRMGSSTPAWSSVAPRGARTPVAWGSEPIRKLHYAGGRSKVGVSMPMRWLSKKANSS